MRLYQHVEKDRQSVLDQDLIVYVDPTKTPRDSGGCSLRTFVIFYIHGTCGQYLKSNLRCFLFFLFFFVGGGGWVGRAYHRCH